MSSPRTDRPGHPGPGSAARPRTEPVLALIGAAAALSAGLLDDAGDLWVVLDIAALLTVTSAIAMVLHGAGVRRGRPAFDELATGTVTAGISGSVLLLAEHGPQARVGTLLLGTAAAMGAVLTVLVLGGAVVRYRRERADLAGDQGADPGADFAADPLGAAPAPPLPARAPLGMTAGMVTVAAAALAVAAALRDAVVR